MTALSLKEQLHEFFTQHQLLGRDRQVHFVVAYSGGKDSTALLHSLAQLKAESQIPIQITAAYYWHPWRPLQQDLMIIHQNCKRLNIPWVNLTPNLTLPKTETAAREDRYQQLSRLCYDLNATALLTAHHQDDQVETILFRMMRGTGLDGLTGIPPLRLLPLDEERHVKLARPFLDVPRSAITDYIQQHHLAFVEDPTNADTSIKRNFLRLEIVPRLKTAFPQLEHSLVRLAELAEGELEIIHSKMDEIWDEVYDKKTHSLDEVLFSQLSQPFQRRIIRRFLEQLDLEAGYQQVMDVIAFIEGKHRKLNAPSLFSLGKELFLSIYRNRISVEKPQKQDILPLPVHIPGAVCHRDLHATVQIIPLTPEQRMKPIDYATLPKDEAYVDLSRFEGKELILRTRKEGDRIKPLGMKTPIKLKRFFINRFISRFERDSILLLTNEKEVLWAVGVGLSEDIRVKDRPTHLITIKKDTH